VNPWHAAISSFISFVCGAVLPLIAIVLPPPHLRLPVTIVGVLIALGITAFSAARLGRVRPFRPVVRNLAVGGLTMGITFIAGMVVGL
jgi:VIT1/CCC1 family predicted Fe2+/Mn2+ transporter